MLIPRRNRRDLDEVPLRLRRRLNIVFVDNMDQVVPVALAAQRDASHVARWAQ